MDFAVTDLATNMPLDPSQFIGIPFALVGAVFMSFGAQFQHRGVNKVEVNTENKASGGLNMSQLRLLLGRPSWVIGTALLALAIVFQLVSLKFSPLIVVQPLGAVALVVTAILNSRLSNIRLNKRSILAIALCVGGVGLFVTVAAFTARDMPVRDPELITILIVLGSVLVLFGAAFVFFRHRLKAIIYVFGAGVLYGFVATLAKVVIARISQDDFDILTIVCVIALIAAMAFGAYFVQNAYSSGPPDLVIAGLTVIDPLVAVTIGIVVLKEALEAPGWAAAAYVFTGILAIIGVFLLAKYHPQSQDREKLSL